MVTHMGFSAWITCEGREIIEYEPVIDHQQRRVSCWIPGEAGKDFTVHWRDNGSGVDSATYIKLDGFTVPGHFLYGDGEACRSAIRVGSRSAKPFMFARQASRVSSQNGQEKNMDVGTIAVKIKLVRRMELRPPNAVLTPPKVAGSATPTEPRVGYGKARETYIQTPSTWTVVPYDPANPGTHVTFVFRYRSQEFLAAQGIMSASAPLYRTLIIQDNFMQNDHSRSFPQGPNTPSYSSPSPSGSSNMSPPMTPSTNGSPSPTTPDLAMAYQPFNTLKMDSHRGLARRVSLDAPLYATVPRPLPLQQAQGPAPPRGRNASAPLVVRDQTEKYSDYCNPNRPSFRRGE